MRRLLNIWRAWSTKQRLALVGGLLVTVAGAAVGAYLIWGGRPADVSHGTDVTFHEKQKPPERNTLHTVNWPIYGLDSERTRYLPANGINPPLGPPVWTWDAHQLLEFSPIYVHGHVDRSHGRHKTQWQGHLYVMDKNAVFYSLSARTGNVDWKRQIGTLNASSPTYANGKLFAVNLSPGQVIALRAGDGKVLWRHPLPGRTESSPLVWHGRVFVGCESGDVFALDEKTGKTKWDFHTAGAVKGGVALDKGSLFFGNYAGQVFSVDASSGKQRWSAETQGGGFLRGGGIYSTPAVAYGRVYLGGLDGRVYSYSESNGELAWSHSTGGEVYPAPAVADTPDSPPSVYVGSLDHHFYALDARTGEERWDRFVDGAVLGASSVIGNTVYMAVIGPNIGSFGFDAGSGKQVFDSDLGEYNPMISDGRHLYLTGSVQIRAFRPPLGKPHKGKKAHEKQPHKGHQKPKSKN
jgi:outer membrane protein assembly factor BamB